MRLSRPEGDDPTDDAALLRAVARGDTEALALLHDRHAGRLQTDRPAAAAVRNALGFPGLAVGGAAAAGARASWLPPVTYTAAVWLTPPDAGAAAWWGWALRPAPEGAAWTVACALLCAGTVLFAWRGPRPGRG